MSRRSRVVNCVSLCTLELLERRRLLSASLTTLASFVGTNGSEPMSPLIEDSTGNLYGTAFSGGTGSGGTIFEWTASTGKLTALASLNYSTGEQTTAGLLRDASGNLFGSAPYGEANGGSGHGTVFELPSGKSTVTVLGNFNLSTGANPMGGLTQDPNGLYYGTTSVGGLDGEGTIYRVTPAGQVYTIQNFDQPYFAEPLAAMTADNTGYGFYGTTKSGGTNQDGTVFVFYPENSQLFQDALFNGTNGANPEQGVCFDSSDNLYGVTRNGGSANDGTIFEIPIGTATITPLVNLNASTGVVNGLIADNSGNLFGTTTTGGTHGDGSIFEVAAYTHAYTTLFSFNGSNGSVPDAGMIADKQGNLYGTTSTGGTSNDGTVFKLAGSGFGLTPNWLDLNGSATTWNSSTKSLVVSGSPIIVGDPGTDAPIITFTGTGDVLTIASPTATVHVGSLAVTGNSTVTFNTAGGSQVQQVLVDPGAFTIAAGSTVNINNNLLDLKSASVSSTQSLITSGQLTGSNASVGAHLGATAAIVNNGIYAASGGLGTFDQADPGSSDTLVRYTYHGDANLNGKVDGSDYTKIDSGYLNHSTGWMNGDLNGDGTVNGSDYTLIDNAFNRQGVPLGVPVAQMTAAPIQRAFSSSDNAPFSHSTLPFTTVPTILLVNTEEQMQQESYSLANLSLGQFFDEEISIPRSALSLKTVDGIFDLNVTLEPFS